MGNPIIGDVVLFQQNCQQYEHTGKVIAIFPGLFMVEELPVDPLGEPFGIILSMDWWKIVARHGKPYVSPGRAGPICSAVPILEGKCGKMDATAPRRRKRFFESPRHKASKTKKKGAPR
jgi:hypothetical protein